MLYYGCVFNPNIQLPYDGTNQQVQWVELLALSAVLIRHPSFLIQYSL